ncbi:MAG: GNAT family N-acetyltransferase [Treponema sp.]
MVRLEKINSSDFSQIVEWNKNTTHYFLQQWAGREYSFPLSVNQIEEKYSYDDVNLKGSSNFSYKIINEKNAMIGCIDLLRVNYERKHATVGKFLIGDVRNRNKGYGKQTMNEALKIAFEKLGLQKVRLCVYDFNHQAIKCYESVGFKKDTFVKNVCVTEGGKSAGCYLMHVDR